MQTMNHYENAHFLRELAESLPGQDTTKVELLQRLADEELAQAEYDEWVRRISIVGQHVLYELDDPTKTIRILAVVGQRQKPRDMRFRTQ